MEFGEVGGELPRSEQRPRASNSRSSTKTLSPTVAAPGLRPGDDAAGDGGAVNGADQDEIPGGRQVGKEVERGGRPSRMRQSAMSLAAQACAGVDAKVSKSTSAETLMLVTGVRSVAVRKQIAGLRIEGRFGEPDEARLEHIGIDRAPPNFRQHRAARNIEVGVELDAPPRRPCAAKARSPSMVAMRRTVAPSPLRASTMRSPGLMRPEATVPA